MFEAIIKNTKVWKNSIDAIAVLIDEGTLQITEVGLKVRAMDPSQIAMIDFEMPKSAFEKYEIDEPTNLGVDFSELNKITKRAKAEDKIELSMDTRLKLIFRGKTTRTFNLPIIESSSTPPKKPDIVFAAVAKLGANTLKDTLSDAELMSNHAAIKMNGGFSIKAEGDVGSANIEFSEDMILSLEVKTESRAVFSIEMLNNLLKAADSTTVVNVHLKTDAPLMIQYEIGEGRVFYFLAPRIESV